MDKAISFGSLTVLARWSSGFGFYIETVPEQLRPEDGEMYHVFIVYSATAIKLPFFQIEIGKFRQLEEGELELINLFPGIFTDDDEDDDDEDPPAMH